MTLKVIWQTIHAKSHNEEKASSRNKRAALRPPAKWRRAALAFQRASAHKSIYRKIRPRTATEMNRRGRWRRMVLIPCHIKIQQAAVAQSRLSIRKGQFIRTDMPMPEYVLPLACLGRIRGQRNSCKFPKITLLNTRYIGHTGLTYIFPRFPALSKFSNATASRVQE